MRVLLTAVLAAVVLATANALYLLWPPARICEVTTTNEHDCQHVADAAWAARPMQRPTRIVVEDAPSEWHRYRWSATVESWWASPETLACYRGSPVPVCETPPSPVETP